MRITGEMGNLAAWEKRLFYMCSARPTLHPRALFSDVTSDYRSPAEPVPGDEVTIRLRTGRYNVDKAYLVVDNVEHVMTRVRSESMFDYYEAKINVGTDKIYYYFKCVITIRLGRLKILIRIIISRLHQDLRHLSGQRVQLCTRYL